MKKGLVAAAAIACLMILGSLLYPTPTRAESAVPPPRTLSVTGQGRIELKPDTADITLGVTQLRPTPEEAYNAMSENLVAVAAAIKGMGVKDDQVKTGVFNLQAEYNWTQEKGQVLTGYRASTTLTITTQELEKVAGLVQTAVAAGSNQMNGIRFYVKDTEKLVETALDMAADDARAKADRVAERLGAKVVRVNSVSVQDNGTPILFRDEVMMAEGTALKVAAQPAPVYGGTTTFSVTVSVVFEID